MDALLDRIPVTEDGRRVWESAPPYALRHIATHAAPAGRLDELIADGDYLVHAEPDTLLAAFDSVTTEAGRLARLVYRRSIEHHRVLSAERRRQVLAVDAALFRRDSRRQEHAVGCVGECCFPGGRATPGFRDRRLPDQPAASLGCRLPAVTGGC
ncbi:hypothetical protein [Nocardia sp. BMG51109]|uniref:hypothetical protein n=1 Tax=Nocardia sp. BMG51109 TaxID=1056816 RepID=UPI0012EC9BF3|nr:hypothetical protein [Nocardia sp. BMG51109]